MPLFAMTAKDKPEGFAHRQSVRPIHLKHLNSLGNRLVLAGPFQDEEGRSTGSIVVIEAGDLAEARSLLERDPFVTEGVFTSWEISRWALTINKSAGR
jgi:uncharacterized protein YciI